MQLKRILLVLIVCIACYGTNVTAQSYTRDSYSKCVSASLNFGMSQYRGEYHGFRHVLKTFDMNFGFGLKANFTFDNYYVRSAFNSVVDKRLSIFARIDMLSFSSDMDRMDLKMDGRIFETALGAEINLLRFSSNTARRSDGYHWTPYITIGMALSGVKTSIPDISIDDNSYRFFPSVLFGGGFKFVIFKGIAIGLEGGFRFMTTDDMDYSNINDGNDLYYFGGLQATFNIGELFF